MSSPYGPGPGSAREHARAIRALNRAGLSFLVGGTYALHAHTGIWRDTKDLDVFIRPGDVERGLAVLEQAGFRPEHTDPRWLAKAWGEMSFVDLIFGSASGATQVDDAWFENGQEGTVLGERVLIAPPEEIVWSKAYVADRERYDGADLVHLFRVCGASMKWDRLLQRMDNHWSLLLSYLALFRFTYPTDRRAVPDWLWRLLLRRAGMPPPDGPAICRGPLLSPRGYAVDVEVWGDMNGRYADIPDPVQPPEAPSEVTH